MKTLRLPRAAKRCGVLAALFCLAFSPRVFAQPVFPILGPMVRITSPQDHATFFAPVDIPVFAYVHGAVAEEGGDATLTNVEFFAGTNDLGRGFNLGVTNSSLRPVYANFVIGKPVARLGSIYCLVWTNASAGSYSLTAVASGHYFTLPVSPGVVTRTSAPVNITILASTTNANPTDIVSIVATDPIAIAGTNSSWIWAGMTNAIPAWANWPPPYFQSFTNWGPKNAIFTVRRFGDAGADLTVNYNIGGTAGNGVDYATLTNSVTIPAGEAYALIPIVPIDNGATNFSKTVILTLTPDASTSPNYVLGIPRSAEALILDNWRRPLPFLLPDGSFHVNATGPDGAWFSVQSSSDLQNWTSVSTNQAFQGSIDFIDPDAPDNSSQFYRALPVTNTPSD
ncbi:MAG TPA: hypothetical protein VGH42_04905 [Verrucomicrobiae bacterium]|jgi:hypothetical protein